MEAMKVFLSRKKKAVIFFILLSAFLLIVVITPDLKYRSANDTIVYKGQTYVFASTDDFDRIKHDISPYTESKPEIVNSFPLLFRVVRTIYNGNIIVMDAGVFGDDFYIKRGFTLPKPVAQNIESIYVNYEKSERIDVIDNPEDIKSFMNSLKKEENGSTSKIAYLKIKYQNYDGYEVFSPEELIAF